MHDELMDADLNDLEILKEFTLESKLLMCQQLSCRIMTASGVDIRKAYEENIMPWELETFTAYSILFDDASANKTLDVETFSRCITLIRNYWPNKLSEAEKDGVYPETFIMISALQQYPVQGVYLQKLFRSHYFFTFTNENLDMKKIFNQKMGVEYERLETSVYKGYKRDKIEMRGDRAEMSDFPLYLNTVAGGLDRRDQTIGGFSFVVKIYAVPVVEIIG